jgi:NAD(P)-dependent dehydrogenase (short-subunit alcohol dehydrogenase family)
MTQLEPRVDLAGRAIIVTGAAGGFGAAYACHLADLGASVVLNDLDADRLEAVAALVGERERPVVTVVGSVADWALAERLSAVSVERFGRLDAVVNAAGAWAASEPWAESEVDVRAVLEANVLGTFACGSAAARTMKRCGGGSIVNLCSTAAFGLSRLAAYSASKGAVLALTRSWALDLAAFGVTVNAVAPTGLTSMSVRYRNLLEELGTPSPNGPPPATAATVGIVGFLCSEAARSITGQLFWVAEREVARIDAGGGHTAIAEADASNAERVAAAFESGSLGSFS